MFRFHQDRPEAGDGGLRIDRRGSFPGILWKKAPWELGESEVEVAPGGLVEEELGEGGGGFRRWGADGPEDDVQLRRRCLGEEVRGFGEALVKFQCGGVAGFETLGEGAAGDVRE